MGNTTNLLLAAQVLQQKQLADRAQALQEETLMSSLADEALTRMEVTPRTTININPAWKRPSKEAALQVLMRRAGERGIEIEAGYWPEPSRKATMVWLKPKGLHGPEVMERDMVKADPRKDRRVEARAEHAQARSESQVARAEQRVQAKAESVQARDEQRAEHAQIKTEDARARKAIETETQIVRAEERVEARAKSVEDKAERAIARSEGKAERAARPQWVMKRWQLRTALALTIPVGLFVQSAVWTGVFQALQRI